MVGTSRHVCWVESEEDGGDVRGLHAVARPARHPPGQPVSCLPLNKDFDIILNDYSDETYLILHV